MKQLINVVAKESFGKIVKQVPFLQGAEVTFFTDVPGSFGEQLEKKRKELGEVDAGYWSALETIAEWNFAGEDGKELPLSVDSFKKLSLKLQKWIFEESQKAVITDEEYKKKSSEVLPKP